MELNKNLNDPNILNHSPPRRIRSHSVCQPLLGAEALGDFLHNDVNMVLGMLIVFEMFAGAAKFAYEPQKLIHAKRAIVKCLALKAA